MEQSTVQGRHNPSFRLMPERAWKTGSIVIGVAAIVLALLTLAFHRTDISGVLLTIALFVFCAIAALHARFLHLARAQYRHANDVLDTRERELESLFQHALDAVLILDNQALCRDANPAALHLLGLPRERLIGELISRFYASPHLFDLSWDRLLVQMNDRGQLELVGENDATVFVEFTARANFLPGRHMMILRDITARHRAEEAMERNLALAKSASREAEALRQATLALTQDLRLDYVLDTLLKMLHSLVPYGTAQILLCETETKLFLAREVSSPGTDGELQEWPKTLDVSGYPLLKRALGGQDGILTSDTGAERTWTSIGGGTPIRSWIGVPLLSSHQVLGLLSLSHVHAGFFSQEDLRRTRALSISAAAAIQNARIYEQAEIYGAELERRLTDLHQAQANLQLSEENRHASEERFRQLFRSTPIAFSVTVLQDGTFIDVNEAFERRYGYKHEELIGRTSAELGFWEKPQERSQLVEELRHGIRVRGRVSRFRLKSGDWRVSVYSAETIALDGQACLLVVSDDLRPSDPKHSH
jgi:PAS domain S-box-containing protein